MPMLIENINTKSAQEFLKEEGNPFPLLSGEADFDSDADKKEWQKKARKVRDLLHAVASGNCSTTILRRIRWTFEEDPECQNLDMAEKLYRCIRSQCHRADWEDYASMLKSLELPDSDVKEAVYQATEHYKIVLEQAELALHRVAHLKNNLQ